MPTSRRVDDGVPAKYTQSEYHLFIKLIQDTWPEALRKGSPAAANAKVKGVWVLLIDGRKEVPTPPNIG